MKKTCLFCTLLILFTLSLSACQSAGAPPPPPAGTQSPPPASAAPTASATLAFTPTATAAMPKGEDIPLDQNVLVLAEGQARISHDNGNTWTATDTGQVLVAEDEIQLSEEGLAFIFFFNGAVVRLEGPTDFQVVISEKDAQTGATRIVTHLWDGYAVFETNPLPTPDSVFQMFVYIGIIDVGYDAEAAAAIGQSLELNHDLSVIAGASMDEASEMAVLHYFKGPASLYVLGEEENQFLAGGFAPGENEIASLEIAYLNDLELELFLENFTFIAGYLLRQYQQTGTFQVNMAGYQINEIETLDTGGVLYFFSGPSAGGFIPGDPLAAPHPDASGRAKSVSLVILPTPTAGAGPKTAFFGSATFSTTAAFLHTVRNPPVSSLEVKLLYGNHAGFGCNPNSGWGCPLPSGCNQITGSGCTLTTGCNLVTKEGCDLTTVNCDRFVVLDENNQPVRAMLVCPASRQPGCNPNIAGDCDRFYRPEDWGNEGDIEWCWCPATPPPPGMGPPPPGWTGYYRCWCSDPGARRTHP